MQNELKREIKRLCARAIARSAARLEKDKEYAEKFEARTGKTAGTIGLTTGNYVHRHFDPLYSKRNANFLAKTIWRKVLDGTYAPKPALRFTIPKPGGKTRQIMQFSFPDAALARVLNKRLTLRNLKKQSGNSFAYRPDRNVFDALLKVKSSILYRKNFVTQLDFENYFDSIPHPYIRTLLRQRDLFTISSTERAVIERFLTHQFADRSDYQQSIFTLRSTGTPQGSSISLSLANLANHKLDAQLEAVNGQFARYADDTVAVCYGYEDALKVYEIFVDHCRESGLKLNAAKSPGICILSDTKEEVRSITSFKFLGYDVSQSGLHMHSTVEKKIRQKLSNLINLYLLHYIEQHGPKLSRADVGHDWDLLGAVTEIRNVLYGGLTELDLRQFIREGTRLPQMKGMMGFYALLDGPKALTRLDGWIISTLTQALHKRYKIFSNHGKIIPSITARQLISGSWYDASKHNSVSFKPDPSVPSFVRGWAAARKHYFSFGLQGVEPPAYLSYAIG